MRSRGKCNPKETRRNRNSYHPPPALPLSSYPIGCIVRTIPRCFLCCLRDHTQSKEFLLLSFSFIILSFVYFIASTFLALFSRLFAGFVLYHFQLYSIFLIKADVPVAFFKIMFPWFDWILSTSSLEYSEIINRRPTQKTWNT